MYERHYDDNVVKELSSKKSVRFKYKLFNSSSESLTLPNAGADSTTFVFSFSTGSSPSAGASSFGSGFLGGWDVGGVLLI